MASTMPRFEVLSWSFSVDTDWFNTRSPYLPYDVDWIEFAESIGLVCQLSTGAGRAHTGHIVKVSGVFLLIGLGSWLCCKLLKLYRTTLRNSNGPSDESNQGSFNALIKTCYFGPANLNDGPATHSPHSPGGSSSINLNMRNDHRRRNVKYERSVTANDSKNGQSVNVLKRGSFLHKIKSLVSPDTGKDQTTSSTSSKSSPNCSAQLSSFSSPIFTKQYSYDSLQCCRENSVDSISELSFDVESTSTTVARLNKLQEEIDQIKNNCLSMDEEFITIKCNRNMPGLSDLMESGELNESSPTAEEIQNAKTCFKGLYSLTTINHSMSLDLTDVTAMSDSSVKVEDEVEALPSLEWDELDEPSMSSVSDSDRISKLDSSGVFSKPFDSMRSSQVFSDVCESEIVNRLDEQATDIQRCTSYESAIAMSESWSSVSFSELSSPESEAAIENVGPKLDVLCYAATEWKGHTDKAETIRKGYCEIVNNLGLRHLHRIRGDNYCAIRAALFQVLSNGLPLPNGEKVYRALTDSSMTGYLENWRFARLPYSDNRLQGIRQCLMAFDQLVANLESSKEIDERSSRLQHILNSDPLLDLHVVEAIKLFMLERAITLHTCMTTGQDCPFYVVLLFSRDESGTPRDLMNNYLSNVGDSGGLEMVEMFLLGDTLGVSFRVVRPSKYGSDEFICFYPESETEERPQVTLIAEDDRHYNVLVN